MTTRTGPCRVYPKCSKRCTGYVPGPTRPTVIICGACGHCMQNHEEKP